MRFKGAERGRVRESVNLLCDVRLPCPDFSANDQEAFAGVVEIPPRAELFSRVSQPKELHIIPEGDHSLTGPRDRKRAIEHSMRWFQTYLRI